MSELIVAHRTFLCLRLLLTRKPDHQALLWLIMEQVTTGRDLPDCLSVLKLFHTDDTLLLPEFIYFLVPLLILYFRNQPVIFIHHVLMHSGCHCRSSFSRASLSHLPFSLSHLRVPSRPAISIKIPLLLLTQSALVISLNIPGVSLPVAEDHATDAYTA